MLFRLSDVHKSYGAQDVLRGASVQINPGEHVGLVGRNGAGKTTLFRLISNEETLDRGDVVRARGVRRGRWRLRNFRAGSRTGSDLRACCSPNRTRSCSTSRRTTWTWQASNGSKNS